MLSKVFNSTRQGRCLAIRTEHQSARPVAGQSFDRLFCMLWMPPYFNPRQGFEGYRQLHD